MIAIPCYGTDHFGDWETVNDPDLLSPDTHSLVILTGGEDISPAYYGEKVTKARAPSNPSRRDMIEAAIAQRAIELEIPILGICRGAQLLCCMDGGKLWQDVNGHQSGQHVIHYEGTELMTNSCHHQLMIPSTTAKVLAYSPCLSPMKWCSYGKVRDESPEPEIVHFPDLKAIGVQGHPEWVSRSSDLYKLTMQLVKERLCS